MPDRSPAIQSQASNQAGNRESGPNDPLEVTIVQSPADAKHGGEREAASDEHEAQDLEAQVRAADAAEKQIGPAWFAASLSFLGTILIAWSILETRDSKQRELRAYVVLAKIDHELQWDPKAKRARHAFRAVWENRGSTPARFASVSIQSVVLDHKAPADFHLEEHTEGHTTIHPKGGDCYSVHAFISGEDLLASTTEQTFVYLWGSVRYRDVFRWTPQRETRFFFRVIIRGNPARMISNRNPINVHYPHMGRHNTAT
ncbi:MAG: hypothetical protein U1C74_30050 [Phenylobacterium sp.]|uniref:hypothetical protein n=1 Tax=Brevundimonas sp. TaxID=1871086 RepID=UPI00273793F3|nr:hypothetical protein [Brevundimonas sp.]MDP3802834.1 hypothetical protein [Brevundimonas sp.]MDZ4375645.1 hypothetical protein [Phenylobacterium sp.]